MTTFVEYLAGLPASKLDQLYRSPWTCQAVLRSLPPLAKQYLLRMLFIDDSQPLPEALITSWTVTSAKSQHNAAISRLEQMRVLLQGRHVAGQPGKSYVVNPPFREQILATVLSSSSFLNKTALAPVSSKKVPPAELDNYAHQQWEAVLLHLTSPEEAALPAKPHRTSPLVKEIFRHAGLLKDKTTAGMSHKDKDAAKSSVGRFGFLLKDSGEQLWLVISNYVAVCQETRGMDSAVLLSFLLEVGFLSTGMRYSMSHVSTEQQAILEDLAVLGLILLQKGSKDRYFVPTSLASVLSASLSQSSAAIGATKGFIIAETNFKIYAHTQSEFQLQLLSLFVKLECRLPNLAIGEVTDRTMLKAFQAGITADQIIHYLQKHAHPHVASRVPVVPETVVDRVRLWEFDFGRGALQRAILQAEMRSENRF